MRKFCKQISIFFVFMFLISVISMQPVYANSEFENETQQSLEEIITSNDNNSVGILSIPGTVVTRFTRRETIQGTSYESTETRTTTETMQVTGSTLDQLSINIEAAIRGISGSGASVTVGTSTQTASGWSATLTISRTHTLRVLHTPYTVYDILYETITDINTNQSYTYEVSRTYVTSYVTTRYI